LVTRVRRCLAIAAAVPALVIVVLVVRDRGPQWLHDTNNLTFARILLAVGFNGDEPVPGQAPALHDHAFHGHDDMVRLLLDSGANIESRAKFGSTPLLYAVHGGHITTVELLLDHGADINVEGNCYTPYQLAIQHNHGDIARLLLARGASTVPPSVDLGCRPQ